MLNQGLHQKQLQKLSPQQIQLMKLLQVPTSLLEQRIEEELEINPALEESRADEYDEENIDANAETAEEEEENTEAEEFEAEEEETVDQPEEVSLDDYIEDYLDDDDEIAAYKLQANNYSPDEEEKTIPIAMESSFYESLEQQLGLLDLDERQQSIALQIIGSIDDDGYIRRSITALTDDLAFSQNINCTEEDVEYVLSEIQKFDPPGIAARDLQECLMIQLRRLEENDEYSFDLVKLGITIIKNYFDEFTKKHYEKLRRVLSIDEEELKEVMELILHLNPKPASGFVGGKNDSRTQYIMPDFTILNNEGELELTVNSRNAPDLRVSDYYKEMLRNYAEGKKTKPEKEAAMFIRQKIEAAKWFIDAIKQRHNTMFNTMYAIMKVQEEFFLTGDDRKIKPMILKDIAEITNLDISTISRVANSKYVQTEFGTKRLKEFFSEALQTDSGEEVSTLEVKQILTDIVKAESKKKPVSDEKLKDVLMEHGYNIARRTVAKYREQLGIPVARLRKEL